MLDEMSKQRLQRHLQKLTNAAQLSFAERALLHDHNQFLTQMNNEAKVRRSTKSEILGTARVMTYEDLETARAERAAKEIAREIKKAAKEAKKAANSTKAKRAPVGKNTPRPYAPEPKVAQIDKQGAEGEQEVNALGLGTPVTWMHKGQIEYEIVPAGQRAPIAPINEVRGHVRGCSS
jgi:hypothetical protein